MVPAIGVFYEAIVRLPQGDMNSKGRLADQGRPFLALLSEVGGGGRGKVDFDLPARLPLRSPAKRKFERICASRSPYILSPTMEVCYKH